MIPHERGSSRFWLIAAALSATVLITSVQAGKWLGERMLERGVGGDRTPVALTTAPSTPEVVGGHPLAAAIPGQATPIWTAAQTLK